MSVIHRKKIPIWQHETLAVVCEPASELIHCDSQTLWLASKSCGYRYLVNEQRTEKLAYRLKHIVQKSLGEYYFVTAGENRRYQVHLYTQNGLVSQLAAKGCSPMLKHTATVFADEQHLYLVGSAAISKYEMYQNCYYFSNSTNLWQEETQQEECLRQLLEEPNTLCYVLHRTMYLLTAKNDLCYGELHVFALGRPLKLIETKQLKNELKFRQQPRVSSCEESGDIYLFDLHNLYRQSSDMTFARLNRGVFLAQPGQLAWLCSTPTELIVHSWQNSQLLRHSIQLEELDDLAWSGDNIPLGFYFNKPAFSDLVFSIEDRQIQCSKTVFEFYSRKFRKILTDQNSQKNKTMIKLELKFPAFYFLVQQLYGQFRAQLKFDDDTMFELLIFANKFQIEQFQRKCEESIQLTSDNFEQLYDFYRNVETYGLGTRLFKYFVSSYKELAKVIPIGKVEEIVRCLYQPQCQHTNSVEIKAQLAGDLQVRRKDKSKVVSRLARVPHLLQDQTLRLEVCEKCSQFTNAEFIL